MPRILPIDSIIGANVRKIDKTTNDTQRRTQDAGRKALGIGCLALGTRHWTLGAGQDHLPLIVPCVVRLTPDATFNSLPFSSFFCLIQTNQPILIYGLTLFACLAKNGRKISFGYYVKPKLFEKKMVFKQDILIKFMVNSEIGSRTFTSLTCYFSIDS